jgi:uncharacterized protein (TIGR01777 family)
MDAKTIRVESIVPCTKDKAFSYFKRKGAFLRLLPPQFKGSVEEGTGIHVGSRVTVKFPFLKPFVFEIEEVLSASFTDREVSNYFKRYLHHHTVIDDDGVRLVDTIDCEFSLFFEKIGLGCFVRKKLKKLLEYRHAVMIADLNLLEQVDIKPKKILLSGASGFVGSSLKTFLSLLGHTVATISRKEGRGLFFDFKNLPEDLTPFENADVWIHLGGESIQGLRWTKAKKGRIYNSRTHACLLLKELFDALKNPHKRFFVASGVGYYGNNHKDPVNENSPKGSGFLSDVADSLERVFRHTSYHPLFMRFSTVLHPKGGALKKLLLPFRFKGIVYYGSPNNFFPWISLYELTRMVGFCLEKEEMKGPVNFVFDPPMNQKDLFNQIGNCYHAFYKLTIPKGVIHLFLGEMGDETLLVDQKAIPSVLKNAGFSFCEDNPVDVLKLFLRA